MNDKDVKRKKLKKERADNRNKMIDRRNEAKAKTRQDRATYLRNRKSDVLATAIDMYNESMEHDNPELIAAAREGSPYVEEYAPMLSDAFELAVHQSETVDEIREKFAKMMDRMGIPRGMVIDDLACAEGSIIESRYDASTFVDRFNAMKANLVIQQTDREFEARNEIVSVHIDDIPHPNDLE